MIPKTAGAPANPVRFAEPPDSTFRIHTETGRIAGRIEGAEAVRQAIYLILNTERYQYLIHSWNYGTEFSSLFGKPISFVLPELERRITEALTQDSRIRSVRDFAFENEKKTIRVSFVADTIYGPVPAERTVNI